MQRKWKVDLQFIQSPYLWLQFKVQSDNEVIREVVQEDEEKNDEGGRAIQSKNGKLYSFALQISFSKEAHLYVPCIPSFCFHISLIWRTIYSPEAVISPETLDLDSALNDYNMQVVSIHLSVFFLSILSLRCWYAATISRRVNLKIKNVRKAIMI